MKPIDDDRIDFSTLDPTLNKARFDATVLAVAARGAQRRAARAEEVMLRFWRPALALAASIALAAWGPSLLSPIRASSSTSEDPAGALLQWSSAGTPSSAAEILESLEKSR